MMLVTTFAAMVYLLIVHIGLGWDVDVTTCVAEHTP